MRYIIGQIFGVLSTVCTILLPYFRKKMADSHSKHRG